METDDAIRVGPFGDTLEDFAHLNRTSISLVVQSEVYGRGYPGEDFRNICAIDLRNDEHDEQLVDKVLRRVPFNDWYRLTGILDTQRRTLYDYHESLGSGAEEALAHARREVGLFHDRIRFARGVNGYLLLEVPEAEGSTEEWVDFDEAEEMGSVPGDAEESGEMRSLTAEASNATLKRKAEQLESTQTGGLDVWLNMLRDLSLETF
jgi:hypothetical protein